MPVVDLAEATRQTLRLDVNARYSGLPTAVLMENAGRGAADVILSRYGTLHRVAVVCGLGNNGGDGFVVARHLLDRATVTVFLLGAPADIATAEARANFEVLERSGTVIVTVRDSAEVADCDFGSFDLIVDAMLGTGTRGEPREPYRAAIVRVNASPAKRVSLDVPSGHGSSCPVEPDVTLSFQVAKTPEANVLPLGVPAGLSSRIGPGDVKVLNRRTRQAHKGQAGRVLLVGGSVFFRGALEYAGRAAATVADLVYHCAPRPCEGVVHRLPELLGACLDGDHLELRHLEEILRRAETYRVDTVLIGPGLGLGPGRGVTEETRELVARLIPALANRRVVLDADGLNAMAGRLDGLGPHVALTPHRGEFRALAGKEADADAVKTFARRHGCVVVVKGPIDIVSDGSRTRFNHTGNPGMATGGTGDVLSGALAAFAATSSLFDSACAAAFVTGLAGDLVGQTQGEHFTAADVAATLGTAIRWAEEF